MNDNPRGTAPDPEAHAAYTEYVTSGFANLGPQKMLLVEAHQRWMAYQSTDKSAGPKFDEGW